MVSVTISVMLQFFEVLSSTNQGSDFEGLGLAIFLFLAMITLMTIAVIVLTILLAQHFGKKLAKTKSGKPTRLKRFLPPVVGVFFAIIELLAWMFLDLSGVFGAELTVLILIACNVLVTVSVT
jgi:hypothetical protein